MSDETELQFIRIFTADHIPKDLIEQVKDRDYPVERYIKYLESSLLIQTKEGPTLNPLNHVYVVTDKDKHVVGYLWFTIDSLSEALFVQHYSMKKEYWNSKKSIPMVKEFLKEIRDGAGLKKVFWLTSRPKAYEKHGFKRSKRVLIEVSEE